ncbi:MAG: helix-turn-helix domain-containing protein [Clostridia bacterium]|nr:helix-turn-helix domain-containing protein [Clostridia bacterium]
MINNIIFCKSFAFNVYRRANNYHTDNSAGVDRSFFAYMIRGNARIVTRDESVTVREGDVFFIPLGCKYHSYWHGDSGIEFISLGFRFLPDVENRQYAPQVIPKNAKIVAAMTEIAGESTLDSAVVGKFYTLAGQLIPRMTCRPKGKQGELVDQAARLLIADPHQTASDLAKACAVSESALYAAFKKHSDKSIYELKHDVLMEKAKDLLISTDDPIEEISRRLRFSSGAYFRKRFKEAFGISPREMRKKHGI